ncbi:MAG: ATP-binding protein [Geminicoccaceae bacterium]
MRIAVTGTHRVGKTTLVEDFLAAHPSYGHEPEPYHALCELGVGFADEPEIDDFLRQLEHSIDRLDARSAEADVIFDRCPLDIVAYLQVLGERDGEVDIDDLLDGVEEAVRTLDLVVFLPLTSADAAGIVDVEQPVLRRLVDRKLKTILRDDTLGLFDEDGPRLVEIMGPPAARLEALARAVGS